MKSKGTVSVFFSIAFMGALALVPPAACAAQNVFAFHGALVNSGCEASVAHPTGQHHAQTPWSVRDDRLDACAADQMPIASSYVEETSIMTGERSAVVTLTYL